MHGEGVEGKLTKMYFYIEYRLGWISQTLSVEQGIHIQWARYSIEFDVLGHRRVLHAQLPARVSRWKSPYWRRLESKVPVCPYGCTIVAFHQPEWWSVAQESRRNVLSWSRFLKAIMGSLSRLLVPACLAPVRLTASAVFWSGSRVATTLCACSTRLSSSTSNSIESPAY